MGNAGCGAHTSQPDLSAGECVVCHENCLRIQSGCERKKLYQHIRQWAADMPVEPALLDNINKAAEEPLADYVHQQGWVMIAFQNALYQLLHAPSLEAGVVDTIMRGGDKQVAQ